MHGCALNLYCISVKICDTYATYRYVYYIQIVYFFIGVDVRPFPPKSQWPFFRNQHRRDSVCGRGWLSPTTKWSKRKAPGAGIWRAWTQKKIGDHTDPPRFSVPPPRSRRERACQGFRSASRLSKTSALPSRTVRRKGLTSVRRTPVLNTFKTSIFGQPDPKVYIWQAWRIEFSNKYFHNYWARLKG